MQPLARRIHDRVLQTLGTAMMRTEMCEALAGLGRQGEILPQLVELRASLDEAVSEMRAIMLELSDPAPCATAQPNLRDGTPG